jgi:cation:H+ antiporter
MLSFIILIVGFVILIYSANYLVKGSSSLAKRAGLSSLFIGLTIVAFGTSLPELAVNLFASFKGSNDIAIGNVIGSNIANILLILGVSSAIYPLAVMKGTVNKEIPFALLAVLAVYILGNDYIFDQGARSSLSRGDGLVFLLFFAIFMYYTASISKNASENPDEQENVQIYSYGMSALMIIGGIIGLVFGGNILVDSAITIAKGFGLSEALIGLTIVAIGTSLPELATSAVAAYKKSSDIAIGNIVGSNIFNIFWILGVSAVINPLTFSDALNVDVMVNIFATVILAILVLIGRKHILQRWQGISMIAMYVLYLAYLVIRDVTNIF